MTNEQLTRTSATDAARPRLWIFVALYFCEGAPIGFLWWALPTLLRAEHIAVERIAFIAAVLALPWSFKFLVAPLVDGFRGKWWGFREWTLIAQALMGLLLLPLIWIDWQTQADLFLACLIAHAVCAAVQDCAIDAAAIHAVPQAWRGKLNGRMQAGMLLGRSLFGGGVLVVAAWLDKSVVVMLLVGCIWGTMLVTRTLQGPQVATHSLQSYLEQVRQAAGRWATWGGLAAALIAGAGFEAAGALSGPLLIDRGFLTGDIGLFYAGPVVVLTLAGGLLGGRAADRWGSRNAMVSWLAACSLCVLGVALLSMIATMTALGLLLVAWLAMYFCVGGFTAASYAWFMNLTDKRLGATQFSLYMSATNGCEALAARGAGWLFPRGGYGLALAIPALVSLLAAGVIAVSSKRKRVTRN